MVNLFLREICVSIHPPFIHLYPFYNLLSAYLSIHPSTHPSIYFCTTLRKYAGSNLNFLQVTTVHLLLSLPAPVFLCIYVRCKRPLSTSLSVSLHVLQLTILGRSSISDFQASSSHFSGYIVFQRVAAW